MQAGRDYLSISYKKDILDWLDLCKKEACNYPILRETITQYINLIRHLTNQLTNTKMNQEIIETIIGKNGNINKDMIKSFFELSKIQLKPAILKRLLERLINSNKFYQITFDENYIGNNKFEIDIYKENMDYVVKIYFHTIDKILIGVYNKYESATKNPQHKEVHSKDIQEQKNRLISYQIGRQLRTDIDYTNWLWVCEFDSYNNCPWEDILTDEFYEIFEGTILNIYENIIK